VRVIALGIGTEAGALIPDDGQGIVKDDRGAAVLSRLEREPLERLAEETGGVYVDAANWLDLAGLVESTVSQGRAGEFVERREKRAVHRFQWFLAPALLALLLSQLFELPAVPRSRMLRAQQPAPSGAGVAPAHSRAGRAASRDHASTRPVAGSVRRGPTPTHAAGAGLAVLASVWATGLGMPASASEPPPAPPPDPIVDTVIRLSASSAPSADDYAELASVTLEVGRAQQGAGAALPEGAVRDALVSVDVGERMDTEAADWAALRSGLESLISPPAPPPDTGEGQGDGAGEEQGEPQGGSQSGESSQEGQPQSQQGEQGQRGEQGDRGEQGESGDSAPNAGDAADETGESGASSASDEDAAGGSGSESAPDTQDEGGGSQERSRGNPQALSDADAGFGTLGESSEEEAGEQADPEHENEQAEGGASETAGAAERESGGESRPSRLVGGTRSANDELIQERPELAAAVGRMERVREGDAPAVLFDRMNTAEGKVDQDGGSRW
jgi:Ca-activated chloride channel family protein